MMRQDAAGAAQRAADDLADIVQRHVRRHGAGFELGHVEQVGDEAVKPFRLVDDRGQEIGLLGVAELVADVAQRAGGPEHGGQRRLEVMGDGGEQRRAQSFGLGDALDPVHFLDQPHALDGERALIAQRVQ